MNTNGPEFAGGILHILTAIHIPCTVILWELPNRRICRHFGRSLEASIVWRVIKPRFGGFVNIKHVCEPPEGAALVCKYTVAIQHSGPVGVEACEGGAASSTWWQRQLGWGCNCWARRLARSYSYYFVVGRCRCRCRRRRRRRCCCCCCCCCCSAARGIGS